MFYQIWFIVADNTVVIIVLITVFIVLIIIANVAFVVTLVVISICITSRSLRDFHLQ